MSSIGTRIKAARKRRGLSQKALANCICKCASAVSGYENDFQTPPADVLISIARVLDVSVDFLVGFQTQEIYAVNKLSSKQKEIIDLIFAEFAVPMSRQILVVLYHPNKWKYYRSLYCSSRKKVYNSYIIWPHRLILTVWPFPISLQINHYSLPKR